jgi:hypothetical protein
MNFFDLKDTTRSDAACKKAVKPSVPSANHSTIWVRSFIVV